MNLHPSLIDATRYAVNHNHYPFDFYSGVLFGQATRAGGASLFCLGIAFHSILQLLLPDSPWMVTVFVIIAVNTSGFIARGLNRLIFLSVTSYREGIK